MPPVRRGRPKKKNPTSGGEDSALPATTSVPRDELTSFIDLAVQRALATRETTQTATAQSSLPGGTVGTPVNTALVPNGSLESSTLGVTSGELGSTWTGVPTVLASQGYTLDMVVDPEISKLIVEDKFVDFPRLLSDLKQYNSVNTAVSKGEGRRVHTVHSFNDWLTAFHRYASVYLKRYPCHTLPLLKYVDSIHAIYMKNQDWQSYDVNFRRTRVASGVPWNSFQNEIYAMCMTPAPNHPNTPPSSARFDTAPTSRGLCRHFNAGSCKFSPCTFLHACSYCRGRHPAKDCRVADSNSRRGAPQGSKRLR